MLRLTGDLSRDEGRVAKRGRLDGGGDTLRHEEGRQMEPTEPQSQELAEPNNRGSKRQADQTP